MSFNRGRARPSSIRLERSHTSFSQERINRNTPPSADVFTQDNASWVSENFLLEELEQLEINSALCVIFVSSQPCLTAPVLRESLSIRFGIPACFWKDPAQESSGYFGCQDEVNEKDEIQTYSSWFRFLVKHLDTVGEGADHKISYGWYKFRFFTRWSSNGSNVILCFDLPLLLQNPLLASLSSTSKASQCHDPFSVHVALVEEAVSAFDTSVWSIRDVIRTVEKNRAHTPPQPDYSKLHELARHIIHSSETLAITIRTLLTMGDQHEAFICQSPAADGAAIDTRRGVTRSLQFQLSIVRCLEKRSQALEARLRNEINLAFNLVAQYDSRISVMIGQAAQQDSRAMKTIAVLTVVFLPGTFVASFFNTTFFNFSPANPTDPEIWAVSEHLWVFWVWAVPVTAVVLVCWYIWYGWYARKVSLVLRT